MLKLPFKKMICCVSEKRSKARNPLIPPRKEVPSYGRSSLKESLKKIEDSFWRFNRSLFKSKKKTKNNAKDHTKQKGPTSKLLQYERNKVFVLGQSNKIVARLSTTIFESDFETEFLEHLCSKVYNLNVLDITGSTDFPLMTHLASRSASFYTVANLAPKDSAEEESKIKSIKDSFGTKESFEIPSSSPVDLVVLDLLDHDNSVFEEQEILNIIVDTFHYSRNCLFLLSPFIDISELANLMVFAHNQRETHQEEEKEPENKAIRGFSADILTQSQEPSRKSTKPDDVPEELKWKTHSIEFEEVHFGLGNPSVLLGYYGDLCKIKPIEEIQAIKRELFPEETQERFECLFLPMLEKLGTKEVLRRATAYEKRKTRLSESLLDYLTHEEKGVLEADEGLDKLDKMIEGRTKLRHLKPVSIVTFGQMKFGTMHSEMTFGAKPTNNLPNEKPSLNSSWYKSDHDFFGSISPRKLNVSLGGSIS